MTYLNDYLDRLYEAPENAQAGYRYTSIGFTILHVTSAIQTDEAAVDYISMVEKWYPKTKVMLIEKRNAGQQEWRLIHRVEEASRQLYVLPSERVHMQAVEVPPPVADYVIDRDGNITPPIPEGSTPGSAVVTPPPVIVPPPVDPSP
jgi:hypothetical protein